MLTPAERHYRRMSAKAHAAVTTAGQQQTGSQYELMAAALYEARRELSGIKSIEGKIERKRHLLPQFDPYIEGVLESDSGAQDEVVLSCMVWRFDIGDLSGGLDIAEYAIRHKLETPDRYKRDVASLVVEQTADEVLKSLHPELQNHTDLLSALDRAKAIASGADMHDQILAKLYKAHGYALTGAGDLKGALQNLHRAFELHDKIGVKKDIEKLEREIKKQDAESANS